MKKILTSLILFILGLLTQGVFSTVLLFVSYIIISYDIYVKVAKNIRNKKLLDENLLIMISTIGAFVINKYMEAVAVMLFYQIGVFISQKVVDKSKKSVTKLMDLRSTKARILLDTEELEVNPNKIKINDIIVVKPGERIPLDGKLIKGTTNIDMSSITGESLPKKVKEGSMLISGTINLTSVIQIKVTSTYEHSAVNKILNLMKNTTEKTNTEKLITRFFKIYTPVVCILSILIFLVPYLNGYSIEVWSYRALVFLVASCPCALVICIPLVFFCGVGVSSKNGLLIKDSKLLEKLPKIKTIVFDKTGTITKGVFEVSGIFPTNEITKDQLLELAAYSEFYSNHPIGQSILKKFNNTVEKAKISNYEELDGGIKVNVKQKNILIGNYDFMKKNKIEVIKTAKVGTVVYISSNKQYLGYILISDQVKSNAKKVIKKLRENQIQTIIFSGDNFDIVKKVCHSVDIYTYKANLLPEEKVKNLKTIKRTSFTAFVGDGINDAPVLMSADVGISMGGIGSDAAIEASDIVIMNDDLNKINLSFKIAKKTKNIIIQNLIFAITIKMIILLLGILGMASLLTAVIVDIVVMIITILNCLRMFLIKDK